MDKPKKPKPDFRNKRTAGQIEIDRSAICEQWVKGHTHRDIAIWLNKNRPYQLSRSQVYNDLCHTLEEWKDERLKFRDEWVRKQLLKFARMETELWAAWEASKTQKVRTQKKTVLATSGGKKTEQPIEATVTTESSVGDVAFMRELLHVQAMIHSVLGLNAPKRFTIGEEENNPTAPAIDVEDAPVIHLYLPRNGRDVETAKK